MAAKPTKPEEEVPTTAVAPRGGFAVADTFDIPDDVEIADDGADDVKLRFPALKLIQGTSRGIEDSDRHIGDWWHSDTGEFVSELAVIPLYKQDQRACFEDDNDSPVCSSIDGLQPLPHQPLWQKVSVFFNRVEYNPAEITPMGLIPQWCSECPLSQFVNGNAPVCGESILTMVMREDKSFAQMRISGTGLGPFRNQIGKLIKNNKRIPMFSHIWIFSSKAAEKTGKKWRQLTVSVLPLAQPEFLAVNEVVKAIRSEIQQEVEKTDFAATAGPIIDGDEIDY